MKTMTQLLTGVVLAAAAAIGTGCSPTSVTFHFGSSARVDETVVAKDEGVGWSPAKVAIIDVEGVISESSGGGLFGSEPSTLDLLAAHLREAENDSRVKGVILAINSPGGSVTASDIMYHEIRRFREQSGKPVVAHLGEVAASGGYYIALAADEIIAEPTSLTGSIGVIFPTINVSNGLGRIGVKSRSVVSRPNKDMANPLEPMEEEHYEILQGIVDDMYARFRTLVLTRRHAAGLVEGGKDSQRAEEAMDGRIMTGEKAVELRLADSTGTLRDAYARVKEMAGLDRATLIKYHGANERARSMYSRAGGAGGAGGVGAAGVEVNLLRVDVADLLGGGGFGRPYYLWAP